MAVVSFKCPNCDGELVFDPATQDYKCVYCASHFTQKQLEELQPATQEETVDTSAGDSENPQTEAEGAGEETASSEQTDSKTEEENQGQAVVYNCPSCGAQIVTDDTTAATFCYYCHNPVVLGGRLEGKYLPNKIIPFKISKTEAERKFQEYIGKKKFVPKAFFQKKKGDALSGVYFPYWLYNVDLQGSMNADAKKLRVWMVGDEEYTETKFYQVSREGEIEIGNMTENALKKANEELASGVMPYQLGELTDFHMGYLSGFQAEKRDIEREAVQNEMQTKMRKSAETLLRESVSGYQSVTVKNSNVFPIHEDWFYTLFPVWTFTYHGKNGKIYYYSMNGQTGKVCGELPIDQPKLLSLCGVVGLIVVVLALIGGYFL